MSHLSNFKLILILFAMFGAAMYALGRWHGRRL